MATDHFIRAFAIQRVGNRLFCFKRVYFYIFQRIKEHVLNRKSFVIGICLFVNIIDDIWLLASTKFRRGLAIPALVSQILQNAIYDRRDLVTGRRGYECRAGCARYLGHLKKSIAKKPYSVKDDVGYLFSKRFHDSRRKRSTRCILFIPSRQVRTPTAHVYIVRTGPCSY